jgi:hypothetical protein
VTFSIDKHQKIQCDLKSGSDPKMLGILLGVINAGALTQLVLETIMHTFDVAEAHTVVRACREAMENDEPAVSPSGYFMGMGQEGNGHDH